MSVFKNQSKRTHVSLNKEWISVLDKNQCKVNMPRFGSQELPWARGHTLINGLAQGHDEGLDEFK
ncbi:MAG: hypothetical protein DWC07_06330 [Candidatus Poseidoniales archaeon]|nr:MAG: hypothetical protein DWC07_06330 [Candidatus Poseidoniales archaeon]